ncbi:MAG: hypothetical protein A2022_11690 [Deltaproteobacteria bacterium GWF2_42_12]|nr:MAG: hypothetical protein A2022_11690 [Deltaproteobacteria bacterium GWF2_42_12]OGQ72030.1 MAG: hypothetical protein A2235_08900 [Deltaproteobacteria bacterium RIFOXYA2_FULL_42_10]
MRVYSENLPLTLSCKGLCHNVIARERSDRSNLQLIEKQEIATLPSVARNDKKRIMTQPPGGEGRARVGENLPVNEYQ